MNMSEFPNDDHLKPKLCQHSHGLYLYSWIAILSTDMVGFCLLNAIETVSVQKISPNDGGSSPGSSIAKGVFLF